MGKSIALGSKMDAIMRTENMLQIKKYQTLEGMLGSNNPSDIIKAQAYLQDIQSRDETDRKSYFIDPLEFQNSFGYKDKPTSLSYSMLKSMGKSPIINAIIRTRVNQIAAFAEPQKNKYSVGFRIKKRSLYNNESQEKLTKIEEKQIDDITQFICDCGGGSNFEHDDFDTFIRKFTRDSLVYDQGTFEVVLDRRGKPVEFLATDASTFRIAESIDDQTYDNSQGKKEQINGYYPSYVQIYQNEVVAEFYPWELCFGVRNPSTDIGMAGYGYSELEEMVTTITSMLYGEEYNRRFFKNGSVPKGILRVKGGMPPNKLAEFRQMWNGTMKGVHNFWKTPILENDQAEWIDLQQNNRDMEYGAWMEYLIKIACGIYCIDPAEINFPLSGGAGDKSMFQDDGKERMKNSKDKGLYPLLKFIQKRINKYIVNRISKDFEFEFVGLDAMTPELEQKLDIEALKSYKTINEVRKQRGLKEIDGGDIILDGTFTSAVQAAKQEEQQAQQTGMGMEGEEGEDQQEGQEEMPEWLSPVEGEGGMEDEESDLEKAFGKIMEEEMNKYGKLS